MPPDLADRREYDDLVGALEAVDAIEDSTFLYWYARPSARYPTLEFRVADVCLDVEEAVALAGLSAPWRGRAPRRSAPARPDTPRAGGDGGGDVARRRATASSDTLVSPVTNSAEPAAVVVDELLDLVGRRPRVPRRHRHG